MQKIQIMIDCSTLVHPKEFKTFDSLKQLQYDGNMLTPEERSGLYWDHAKVIVEIADAYNVFSRCMYFNLGDVR